MRSLILFATVAMIACVGTAASARDVTATSTPQTEEQRVLAAEDEYAAAEVSRDEATLRRLLDDRFVYNSSRGTTSGKEELIREVLGMAMVGQTLRERTVLVEGDIAFIFGTADLRFAGPDRTETTSSLRYTSVYVNRQGLWRMLALQMQQRAKE
jgi:ketosteroid isomerase-like protein